MYWTNFGTRRGREQSGPRPALIIQNDLGNEASETTIVAQMTSRVPARDYPFHVVVASEETGLEGHSTVLLEQIQTVSTSRLGRRAGSLSPETMGEIDRALHHSLGLID